VLFPKIDQDIVEPNSYAAWDRLIFNLVQHYKKQGAGIRYWEVANEPDIGESGGCPYNFTPESYTRYYQHTVTAILRADPNALVGGPALANWQSPILPALLEFCSTNHTPLDFVSWHIYNNDPEVFRDSIDKIREMLKKFPTLKPETFIDEWNMSLSHPPSNPGLQPCFLAEVIWQMKDAGLDYSCYYHIRDWYVSASQIATFMSPSGTAFMTRWWDRMPQFDGLFDFQNHVRPTYFAFKLISRLQGDRLGLSSSNPHVHGFATCDPRLLMYNLLLWNYSDSPVDLDLTLQALPHQLLSRHIVLDASTANDDENARLRPEQYTELKPGDHTLHVHLEPYAVHYWSFE
jgi:xylan 1,4-beta-xylosidase